jgi:hypothetical protein
MISPYLLLAGFAFGPLAGPLLPATPATPVTTVAIGPAEKLHGTLTLANHNTLLFFPALNSPNVRVVALLPNGQKAWETMLHKAQIAKVAKAGLVDLRDRNLTSIKPLLLTSVGSKTYILETILDDAQAQGLPLHALVVQELNEQGQMTSKTFPGPVPEGKTTRTVLTAFAEEGALYAVAKEENKREQTGQFFIDRCDLGTGKLTHTPLNLPPPAAIRHGDEFFQDWVFAGFRAGQCYFYRAVKGTGPKADARDASVEFDVKRLGTDGHETSSFRTALQKNLPAGTFVQGGTSFPHLGHAHAPHLAHLPSYADDVDLYAYATGADAEVYVDETTGNCQFAGQYSNKVFDIHRFGTPSLGTFVQSYSPDGQLVKAASAAYTQLAEFKEKMLIAQPQGIIISSVLHDLQTQDLTLQYTTNDREHFVVSTYDAQLTARPVQLVEHPKRKPNEYFNGQIISWSSPNFLLGFAYTTGNAQAQVMVDALKVSPIGLHKSVGQFVDNQLVLANQRKSKAQNEYTVSPTGPTTALVLEAPEEAGGQVAVYAIK